MGKPTLFVINLLGGNPVHFPGSNIEGNVTLELSEPKKTQGIFITLYGLAYCHWTETRSTGSGDNRRQETVHYSDSEKIFGEIALQLWAPTTSDQQIGAGRYEFPFKFQLPSTLVLPTSFEGTTGYIRYWMTANIQRSWKFDHTTKLAITVNEIVDINTPALGQSLQSSNEKTLCCLCCASGPISLSAVTDRSGYCPGESIAISTEGENHSSRRITAVRATLWKNVRYNAHGHHRSDSNSIQQIMGPGIEAGATSNWSNELLPIPATVPTIASCRVVDVSYVLDVALVIPNAINLHVRLPVTIGNVPFRQQQPAADPYPPPQNPYPPQDAYPPQNPYPPQDAYPPQNPYPPVPTAGAFNYASANDPVNIGDDAYTMGQTQYAPVYGFVNDYQFAPPPTYTEAISKVVKD